jgi:hypothetical protein
MYTDYFLCDVPDLGQILAAENSNGRYYLLAVKPNEHPQYEHKWLRYDLPIHTRNPPEFREGWTSKTITKAAAVAIILQASILKTTTSGAKI